MDYKVIAWTHYDNDYFPNGQLEHNDEKYLAIVKDIRDNGYCIYGNWHQDYDGCVPVLNDGKKYLFTQRGWGRVMADVYGIEGETAYAGYMFCWDAELINKCKLPKPFDILDLPRNKWILHLHDKPFENIKCGNKVYELRLNEPKRQGIRKYDVIYFVHDGDNRKVDEIELSAMMNEGNEIEANVTCVLSYKDFAECFNNLSLEECGFDKDTTIDEAVNSMREYYPDEKVQKYGVLAIGINVVDWDF